MIKKYAEQPAKYKLCKYCHHGYILQGLNGEESTRCELMKNRERCEKLKGAVYAEKY